MQRERPTGVTILAILAIIGGVFGLCGGGLGLLGGALGGAAAGSLGASGATTSDTAALAADAGVLTIISIGLLVLSVFYIILGIGALRLSPWAWTLGVALSAVAIIVDVVEAVLTHSFVSPIIGIVISGIILYYLFQPNVRQAFQRA
ncbi:MAG TPA: hypothetical protein VF120_07765 [Ktedonobacterales bacterium]